MLLIYRNCGATRRGARWAVITQLFTGGHRLSRSESASLSRSLARLEERGLIRRSRGDGGRTVSVRLSTSGHRLALAIRRADREGRNG